MAAINPPDRSAEEGAYRSPLPMPVRRQRPRPRPGQAALYLVLIVGVLLALFPLVWALFGSFKAYRDLMESHDLLPRRWTLGAYQYVLGAIGLFVEVGGIAIEEL